MSLFSAELIQNVALFSSFCLHIWQCVHIYLRNGDRENLVFLFLMKLNNKHG